LFIPVTQNGKKTRKGFRMKCLIVEDDPFMSFALEECISELGHESRTCRTLEEATQALHTEKYGVILLDHRLPDGLSSDMSTFAASTQPNCRIILLTGANIYPLGEHANEDPAIDWVLRKPVSFDDISALIDYAAMDMSAHPTKAYAVP
jgi:DNA-binding NtrC family response regulator